MTPTEQDRLALEAFEAVADLPAPDREKVLLERYPDEAVRARVRAMLQADADSAGVLDSTPQESAGQLRIDNFDAPEDVMPDRIGTYRVLDRVGQGGMAVVYEAERDDGEFEQRVALKVIPPAQLTPQWRERFLQERQILARLNHPNIAKLLDGGVAEDSSPFFAMEFIAGLAITDYCDEHRLTVPERLALVASVCSAVGYAHRNLVVHRDLKPSNILVDNRGEVKLLDFGIAKLMGGQDEALTTTGHRALTPGYAAPEQFLGDPVTTATDVYALGVLMYELLLGVRPHKRTTGSPFEVQRDVVERRIRSVRQLGSDLDAEQRTSIAQSRGVSWPRLQREIAGDLETIAFKAMHREPGRRYGSAEALADDIHRALSAQPVQARPDSTWYRVSRFIQRHRVGVVVGSLVAVALITTTGVAAYQAQQANLEARRATETRDFLRSLFEYASPDRSLGDRLTARQLIDMGASRIDEELSDSPALRSEMMQLLAETYLQLGGYGEAEDLALRARDSATSFEREVQTALTAAQAVRLGGRLDDADSLLQELDAITSPTEYPALRSAVLVELGELAREKADFDVAESRLTEALNLDRSRDAPPEDIGRDLYRLATLMVSKGENDEALDLIRQASDAYAQSGTGSRVLNASVRHDLGVLLIQRGELDEAKSVLEEVRQERRRLLGDRHPDLAATIKEIAVIERREGDIDRAEALYLQAADINRTVLGDDHPETSNSMNSLAVLYRQKGDTQKALEYAEEALRGARIQYGDQHPTVGIMTSNVAGMQREVGLLTDARRNSETALAILQSSVGREHQLYAVALNVMAAIKQNLGEYESAEADLAAAIPVFRSAAGADHPHMVKLHASMAHVLARQGRLDEARASYVVAADIGEKALPPEHLDLVLIQAGMIGLDAASGNCERAGSQVEDVLGRLASLGQTNQFGYSFARDALRACGEGG